MYVISALLIIVFFILLFLAIVFISEFYICDNYNCKVFICSENKAPRGTKEYVISLLNEFYTDGVWPLPYVGAAIITPLALWFLDICITVKNFAIIFIISFLVIYFIIAFFLHHGFKFVVEYATGYIAKNCPNTNDLGICMKDMVENDNLEKNIPVTFSTPVNVL